MSYLVLQIILFIAAAAAVGFFVGWSLKSVGASRTAHALDARWRAKLHEREEVEADLRLERDKLNTRAGDAESARDKALKGEEEARRDAARAERGRADAEARMDGLKARADEAERELASAKTRPPTRPDIDPAALRELRAQLARRDDEISRLRSRLGAQTATPQIDAAEAAETERRYSELTKEAAERAQEIATLEAHLEASKEAQAGQATEMSDLRGQISRLEALVRQATTVAAAPPAPAAAAEDEAPETPETPGASSVEEKAAEVEAERAPIVIRATDGAEALGAGAAEEGSGSNGAHRPAILLAAPEGPRDDLQQIAGIGPKIEETLNEIGVFHFRQIADLSPGDVEWVSASLNVFPNRIRRDRWIEQARELISAPDEA